MANMNSNVTKPDGTLVNYDSWNNNRSMGTYGLNKVTKAQSDEILATRFNFSKFQLQRKNHFQVQFLKTAYNKLQIPNDVRFLVKSFPLPKESTETSDINYFNQTIKVAGRTSFENFTMVLRDAIGYDMERIFLNWRNRVYDPRTGRMGIAAEYKLDALVYEFTPNRDFYRAWRCEGVFPTGIDYGDMNYDDGGEKEMSITLSVDRAYRDDLITDKNGYLTYTNGANVDTNNNYLANQ